MESKSWRRLTTGEIEMAQKIFADSIDYAQVKIYRGIPFLPALQLAISPNGHIYFPKHNCPVDFTQAGTSYMVWLIHELTHVWQHQNGFRTWAGGMLLSLKGGYLKRRAYQYGLPADIGCFSQLNMEQQADFLAHYFSAHYLGCETYSTYIPDFQVALKRFHLNPRDAGLLPPYLRKRKR